MMIGLSLVRLGPVYCLLAAQTPQASSGRAMKLLVSAGAVDVSTISAPRSVVVASSSIAGAVGILASACFAAAVAAALVTSVRRGDRGSSRTGECTGVMPAIGLVE